MANNKANRYVSSNEVNRALTIMEYATEKFIGFKVPENIVNAYGFAKEANEYESARKNLENLLVGFFKKSDGHFSKKLNNLVLDPTLFHWKESISSEIDFLKVLAGEKYVDLRQAAETYYLVHQAIQSLIQRRNDLYRFRKDLNEYFMLIFTGTKFDADLSLQKDALKRSVDRFALGVTEQETTTAYDVLVKKMLRIQDEQTKRLKDRHFACLGRATKQEQAKAA